jgi:hypothetical protein
MVNKKGEFGFVWIFAIFAGIAILLLMVYMTSKILDTSKKLSDTEIGKSLSIVLDPLSAQDLRSQLTKISFSSPTKVEVGCVNKGYGRSLLTVLTRSEGKTGEWTGGEDIVVADKYIFSDVTEGSKNLNVFSTSFKYPYKIADLTFIVSKDYCFIGAPTKVKNTYSVLNNLQFDNCSEDQITVCFDTPLSSCEISVEGFCSDYLCDSEYDYGFVKKEGNIIPFTDSLLLAAILSEGSEYNCNVNRLMYRASKIAGILLKKNEFSSSRGCRSGVAGPLAVLETGFLDYDPYGFITDTETILSLNELNEMGSCKLW